nr:ATP-binding protein [Paenibacillus turpanensis]
MKFRVRLTLIFITIIGLSVTAAGIFMMSVLKESHLTEMREGMFRQLNIISATVEWKSSGSDDEIVEYFETEALRIKQFAEARVTFIRADGLVLGDSDEEAEAMDDHLSRVEIQQAKEHGSGTSVRFSNTVKHNMLYVARPVIEGGQIVGYIRLAVGLQDVEQATWRLWSYLLSGLIIVFLFSGLISYRIAQGLTRPLERMTKVAQQISRMNYRARVKVRSKDEIGQLGNAINLMADSLQFQVNRIQEDESRMKSVLDNMISGVLMIDRLGHFVLLNRSAEELIGFTSQELLGKKYDEAKQQFELTRMIEDCFERREPIRDEIVFYFPEERTLDINLAPMTDGFGDWHGVVIVLHDITAIRRLERIRSEFVANVSHELKTPIAAVKGFAETLLAGAVNDLETAKSFLQIIFDESERLNRLIGDILELSKIESKRIPLQFSPVHLSGFTDKIVHMMQAEATKKKINIESYVPEDLYIEADEDRLRQIFINLLSNGVNYTPEGGTVGIKMESVGSGRDEKVRIIIYDTGIGIPKKDIPRIFERFYRVDKARSRSSGGTGLGLSIVKHLVELHKATIRVESEIGIGSRFIIEMPVLQ